MQVFMGQAWADHSQDFIERALRADRITFSDLGIVHRPTMDWRIERSSLEARSFMERVTPWNPKPTLGSDVSPEP